MRQTFIAILDSSRFFYDCDRILGQSRSLNRLVFCLHTFCMRFRRQGGDGLAWYSTTTPFLIILCRNIFSFGPKNAKWFVATLIVQLPSNLKNGVINVCLLISSSNSCWIIIIIYWLKISSYTDSDSETENFGFNVNKTGFIIFHLQYYQTVLSIMVADCSPIMLRLLRRAKGHLGLISQWRSPCATSPYEEKECQNSRPLAFYAVYWNPL